MRNKLNGRIRWETLGRTGPILGGGGQGGLPTVPGQAQGQAQAGQQQGQQGQGNQQGAPAGGQADEFADLFDPITGDNAGGDQGGQQGQQQGAPGAGTPVTMEAIQALLAQQAQATQAEIDRRINGAVQTLGNRARNRRNNNQGGQQGQQGQGNQGGQGQQQGGQQQAPVGVDVNGVPQLDVEGLQDNLDAREVRAAFREYLGEELKPVSTEERQMANMLGMQMVARVSTVDDPDAAGLQIARAVAKQVKDLREHYKKLTIAALRRKNLLIDTTGGQQQFAQGGLIPGAGSAAPAAMPLLPASGVQHFQAAKSMAAAYNEKNGHAAPAAS